MDSNFLILMTLPAHLPGGRKLYENGQKKKAMYLYMTSISNEQPKPVYLPEPPSSAVIIEIQNLGLSKLII